MNNYSIEELYETMADQSIFKLIAYGVLTKDINRKQIINIITLCSDVLHNERYYRGGKFKIDNIIKEIIQISKEKLKMDYDDLEDELDDLKELEYPKEIYKIMKDQ